MIVIAKGNSASAVPTPATPPTAPDTVPRTLCIRSVPIARPTGPDGAVYPFDIDTGNKEKLLKGTKIDGRKYRNHLDGYNLLDYLSGKTDASPRHEFWYVNDDGQIVAARYDAWKVVFLENRGEAFGV